MQLSFANNPRHRRLSTTFAHCALLLTCLLAFTAVDAGAATTCAPKRGFTTTEVTYGFTGSGGPETTVDLGSGAYIVARCAKSGELETEVEVAPVSIGTSFALLPIAEFSGKTGAVSSIRYGDRADLRWQKLLQRVLTKLRERVPARTVASGPQPAAELSRTPRASTQARIAKDTSCSDRAYEFIGGQQWSLRNGALSYYINKSGLPGGSTGVDNIVRGANAWNGTHNNCDNGDQNNVSLQKAGTTSETPNLGVPTGKSVFGFARLTGQCAGALACTATFPSIGGIAEADIVFNSSGIKWTNSGADGAYDIRSTATHEAGHALGLADITDKSSDFLTMYFSGKTGSTRSRTLAKGDVLGMRDLYPNK